ncbi:MAG TPA: hypothetical protein DIC54_15695, partial [Pseudomonas sp.]|nr:hypothetical protein [Pseudomonas sp.]
GAGVWLQAAIRASGRSRVSLRFMVILLGEPWGKRGGAGIGVTVPRRCSAAGRQPQQQRRAQR